MDSARIYGFCRLCLSNGRGLSDVFSINQQTGSDVKTMIQDLLQFSVVKDDRHPWMICQSCLCRLHEFQRFKAQCTRSRLVLEGVSESRADIATVHPGNRKQEGVLSMEYEVSQVEGGSPVDPVQMEGNSGNAVDQFCGNKGPSSTAEVLDEGEDLEVEYCWCRECGEDFLNHREMRGHSKWCRGRGDCERMGPVPGEGHVVESMMVGSDYSPIEITSGSLFDPSICCGRCRKVFRTKERLIRHINRHNFGCKAKKAPRTVIFTDATSSTHKNEVVPLFTNHMTMHRDKNVSFDEDNHKNNPGHGEVSGREDPGRQNSKGRTPAGPVSVNTVSSDQSISTSKHCACSAADENPSFCCPMCGLVFRSRKLLTQHGNKCGERNKELKGKGKSAMVSNITLSCSEGYEGNEEADPSVCLAGKDGVISGFETGNTICGNSQISACNRNISGIVSCICDYCGKFYESKIDMRNHIVKCHLSLNPQKCTSCHRLFMNQEELEEHMSLHPKDKKFFCTVCDESFSHRPAIKKHIVTRHGTDKAFICNICFNGFTSKNDVGVHGTLDHTESEKPYKCSACGKCYTYKGTYNLHVKVCQLKTVSFRCEICGQNQSSPGNLANHRLFHSEERNFACHLCPKRFRLSGHRNLHIRSAHFNQRPYECGICNKRFSAKGSLKVHYSCHSDFRPFECSQCPKSFKIAYALKLHLRVHRKC